MTFPAELSSICSDFLVPILSILPNHFCRTVNVIILTIGKLSVNRFTIWVSQYILVHIWISHLHIMAFSPNCRTIRSSAVISTVIIHVAIQVTRLSLLWDHFVGNHTLLTLAIYRYDHIWRFSARRIDYVTGYHYCNTLFAVQIEYYLLLSHHHYSTKLSQPRHSHFILIIILFW